MYLDLYLSNQTILNLQQIEKDLYMVLNRYYRIHSQPIANLKKNPQEWKINSNTEHAIYIIGSRTGKVFHLQKFQEE